MNTPVTRFSAGPRFAAPIEALAPGRPEPEDGYCWDLGSHVDAVIDCLTDHAVATLDVDGNFTHWNRAAQATTGYRRADIIGRHIAILYTEADRHSLLPERDLRQAAMDGIHHGEGWRLRKDGEAFRARVVLQLSVHPDGSNRGFVMVARDISEHAELLGLRDERDRARKQEALGRLVGPMAGNMIGVLNEIGAGREASMQDRRMLHQAQGISRRQPGCPQASNLHEMISAIDALIACVAGDGIDMRWRLDAANTSVMIDPIQLQTTLLDMVETACGALPHGGTLTLFAKAAASIGGSACVAIGLSLSGVHNVHTMADPALWPDGTASDIAPAIRSGRTKWEAAARQAGGVLVLESEDGAGTTIKMLLPAIVTQATASDGGGLGAKTVLLVDDDTNVLSLVGEMLTYLGHKVVSAQDATEAMQRLRADRSITCLFSDIVMPNGMNGMQLVREARAMRPGLRTALASVRTREELGDFPSDVAFFAKPYALADINMYLNAA